MGHPIVTISECGDNSRHTYRHKYIHNIMLYIVAYWMRELADFSRCASKCPTHRESK